MLQEIAVLECRVEFNIISNVTAERSAVAKERNMIEPEFLKIAEAKGLTLSEEKLGIAVLRRNEQIRFCFNKEKLQAFLKSYGAKESEKELNSSHEVQQMNKSSSDSSEIQIEPNQPLMKEGIQH